MNKARNQLKRKTFAHYRAKGVIKDDQTGKRIIQGIASTGAIDRYNEIITPEGWELENFMKNNVLLWAHNSWSIPPIGTVPVIEVSKEGLPFEGHETETDNEFAASIFDYYEKREMNAFSVGFMPLDVDYHDKDRDDPLYGVVEWTRAELLEISCVPVPANPEALQKMFKNGLDEPASFAPARVVGYDGAQIESAIKAFGATVIKSPHLKDEHKELLRETADSLLKLIGVELKGAEEETTNHNALMQEIEQLATDRYMLLEYARICNKLMKAIIAPKR